MLQPSGPSSQCGTCLGLVQASQTSLRAASMTRVATISRSDGVVNVVALSFFTVAMDASPFLLVIHLVGYSRVSEGSTMALLRVLASALALAACAPEIVRQPTQLTPVTEQAGGTIEILEDTSILVGPARYRREPRRAAVSARDAAEGR